MRRQGPKVRKVCWLVRIGPNFFCRLAASLRVICECPVFNTQACCDSAVLSWGLFE